VWRECPLEKCRWVGYPNSDQNEYVVGRHSGSGSSVAKRLRDKYEFRPQQLEMAAAVQKSLTDGGHLLVEPAPALEKSFAYLLPAIDFAGKTEKACRHLDSHHLAQEQLIDKDIRCSSGLSGRFVAVLVKGRGADTLPTPGSNEHARDELAVRI